LEDHGDVAVFGRDIVDFLAADPDLAVGRFLEARHHAQRGRLAAAGRPTRMKNSLSGIEIETSLTAAVPLNRFQMFLSNTSAIVQLRFLLGK